MNKIFVNGMLAAEKAMQYILNGCQISNYDDEDSGECCKNRGLE